MNFVNKSMELVGVSRILHDKSVSCHLKIEPPIKSFKYDKPIRNKILNYQQTVMNTDHDKIDNIVCDCHKYIGTEYYNHHHQHVITGDMSFVQNDKLKLILEKGPKYRDDTAIVWEKVEKEILEKIDLFETKHGKNNTYHNVFINGEEWLKILK